MKAREQFRATAYKDGMVNGVQMYSIGYGHQIRANEQGLKTATWTKEKASTVFASDVKPLEDQINKNVKHPLTQSQFDAMVDFGYNCGSGALANIISTWNETKSPQSVGDRMKLYNRTTVNGNKVVSSELVSRRAENANMFMYASSTPLLPMLGIGLAALAVLLV